MIHQRFYGTKYFFVSFFILYQDKNKNKKKCDKFFFIFAGNFFYSCEETFFILVKKIFINNLDICALVIYFPLSSIHIMYMTSFLTKRLMLYKNYSYGAFLLLKTIKNRYTGEWVGFFSL